MEMVYDYWERCVIWRRATFTRSGMDFDECDKNAKEYVDEGDFDMEYDYTSASADGAFELSRHGEVVDVTVSASDSDDEERMKKAKSIILGILKSDNSSFAVYDFLPHSEILGYKFDNGIALNKTDLEFIRERLKL